MGFPFRTTIFRFMHALELLKAIETGKLIPRDQSIALASECQSNTQTNDHQEGQIQVGKPCVPILKVKNRA